MDIYIYMYNYRYTYVCMYICKYIYTNIHLQDQPMAVCRQYRIVGRYVRNTVHGQILTNIYKY